MPAPRVPLFAVAALMPLPLLALGVGMGGLWSGLALVYITGLAAVLDQIEQLVPQDPMDGSEFPASDQLLVTIAIGHLLTLPMVVWAVAGQSGLGTAERAAIFIGAGLFLGQVSNPCAHELIHRGNRWLFWLGVVVYGSMLFGHHASAHRLVHHRHAASVEDPNTARRGESYYRFALRAWVGSFRKGWQAETARRAGGLHPYAVYAAISLVSLVLAATIAGAWGFVAWVALSLQAQSQLLLADYVQHYGLMRRPLPDGRLEPVANRHSWNAPHWFSAAMMLNAPRHSDHHANPSRPFPSLRLPDAMDAPRLPYALPVCCTLALSPRLWRRVMHPRLAAWEKAVG